MVMDDRQKGIFLGNTAVAVYAGVLGSVLTLAASNYFGKSTPMRSSAQFSDGIGEPGELALSGNSIASDGKITEELELVHDELKQGLAAASAERSQLAKVIAQLTQQIDTLKSEASDREALAEQDELALFHRSEALPSGGESSFFNGTGEQENSERTVRSLIAAGIDEQSAADIQSRRDQYQLARLELFDQATREGWINSDDFGERLSELGEQRVDLRAELGDSAYDEYLFESGNNNRILLESVINGSAAQIAGLQIGDMVISYADERVFNTRELQSATRAGSRGEYVQVSFERAGQFLSADVPRGPLGVTLRGSRVAP